MDPEPSPVRYVVDSSSWITIEGHSAQNRILSRVGELIEAGRVIVPPEVWAELEVAECRGWLEQYKERLVVNRSNDVDYLMLGGRIAHRFPAMASARIRRSRERADPWVIALAAVTTSLGVIAVVVADETINRRPNRKIPTACAAFGVQCLSLFDMLKREFPNDGW